MTSREEVVGLCLKLGDVYPDTPFHDSNWTVMRHKKSRRGFAFIFQREGHIWVNVKCLPETGYYLKKARPYVLPAYHMNKKHWISILLDGRAPAKEVERLIGESFDLTSGK